MIITIEPAINLLLILMNLPLLIIEDISTGLATAVPSKNDSGRIKKLKT